MVVISVVEVDRMIRSVWAARKPSIVVGDEGTKGGLWCSPVANTSMPARFAAKGDVQAEIDDVAHDMTPLLEWYERDERDQGLGDMPYPPDYPKMPGEPPRVQPSRKNAANWEGSSG